MGTGSALPDMGLRSLSHHASDTFIASLSSSGSGSESIHYLSEAVGIFNHLVPVADSIQVESLLPSERIITEAKQPPFQFISGCTQPPGFQYHRLYRLRRQSI